MMERLEPGEANRRELLLGALAAAALSTVLSPAMAASTEETLSPEGFDEALKKVVGEAQPAEGKIKLELPDIAENGNTVPFNVSVDAPMSEESYVRAIYILSTGNPYPAVASFHFTPASGKAAVAGRMRLAKTQDVVSVAELSDGKFYINRRNVKVTIGGCGG